MAPKARYRVWSGRGEGRHGWGTKDPQASVPGLHEGDEANVGA